MKPKLTALILSLLFVFPIFTYALSPPTWESHLQFTPIDVPLDPQVQEFTFYLSHTYDIDFYLIMAIIQAESNFNPSAVSKSGSYGLMQINKINHTWLTENLGITDFLDPYQNIRAGVYIVADLYSKYGTTEKVLMAYSLGENGAMALWRGGVTSTGYVRKVLRIMEGLK
jgi:soluble lytic murein transglycosylase-like protein